MKSKLYILIHKDSLMFLSIKVALPGFDGNGGPCYIGTGCFHRRETLCGMKYSKDFKVEWRAMKNDREIKERAGVPEENCKALASCNYEENTQWGKEVLSFSLSLYLLKSITKSPCGIMGCCELLRYSLLRYSTILFPAKRHLFVSKESAFVITEKVADDHVYQRYEQEIMEFETTSPIFKVLATLALFNLFSLIGVMKKVSLDDVDTKVFNLFGLQMLLCCLLVFLNLPIYQGLFFRKDSGKMPPFVTYQSLIFALLACTLAMS
ncbi:hypothetical protein REPUB_Repub16aG0089300 [Reevesia pubescens]